MKNFFLKKKDNNYDDQSTKTNNKYIGFGRGSSSDLSYTDLLKIFYHVSFSSSVWVIFNFFYFFYLLTTNQQLIGLLKT